MRVGTRFKSCISYSLRQDHPHACGDKTVHKSRFCFCIISSPCVWGQDKNGNLVPVSAGIIPMRVGTSITTGLRLMLTEDHPHACGDKPVFVTVLSLVVGSSPCVWGQGRQRSTSRLCTTDHPHACGDKMTFLSCRKHFKGSSPCVWGQDLTALISQCVLRIIPMRVGTSCPCVRACCARQDHPHACGDKFCAFDVTAMYPGSSPRVWGQGQPC